MKTSTSSLRAGALSLCLLLACQAATGSSVLVRSTSQTTLELSPVQTYAGRSDPIVTPVKPASPLTVVLLMDGLGPSVLESINKDLLKLYGSLNGHPLRLALLRNGSLEIAGPFTNRARLKIALDKAKATSDPSAPGSPVAFFDSIASNTQQLGANWSRVLLIGEFPALDASVKEYASALLSRAFGSQHLQVNWFAPSGGDDEWLPLFRSTGGTIVRGVLNDFSRAIGEASQSFFQVDWIPAAPSFGFVIYRSALSDPLGQVLLEAPDIAAPAGATLPSIENYSAMRGRVAEAKDFLDLEPISEVNAQRIRDDLRVALEVNPRDPEALLTAAAFNEKLNDYAAAARFRASLVEVRPLDGAAYAGFGHALLLGSDWDKAEDALKRATELNTRTPQMTEDFARIHLARKDDKGALPYLDEALRADAKRQDLWFLEASAAERAGDSLQAIHFFEQGLALGGAHIPESGSLVRLYLTAKQDNKAQELARGVIAGFPPDPVIRAEFAGILDDLQQNSAGLAAWGRVLEVQPGSERAHYRMARLVLESGDARAAERAADEGLAVAPKFAGLYIVKADALEKQGRMYNAREALEEGAANVQDPALLLRLAAVEDTFGGSAADAYARLVESLGASSPERLRSLERGFAVSLRDADLKHAQSFAAILGSEGRPEFRKLLGEEERLDSGVIVPGGLDALAFAAHGKEGVPPEKFFTEYCRTLIDHLPGQATPASKLYAEGIQEHFQRIAALEAFGKRNGNRVVVTLSLNGKDARRDTEKILGLLGLKLRTSKGQMELDRGEKKDQAKKQETASALAIDEVGMQEALQAGKPYTIEISYEWAAVYPSEKLWRETFYAKENEPGGFAAALLRMPKMARLYSGISSLDRKTVSELLSAVNLKTLSEKYSDLVHLFSPAFALQGARAAVPGGPKAEPVWASLTGATPEQPGAFFRALLEREEGKTVAFFFALSQLDRPHQAFFTANLSRTTRFYKLFTDSEEMRRGVFRLLSDSAFTEFLRRVPLDAEGHVDFPGSAEVWLVAKGRSSSEMQTAKLLNKVSKAVAPEVEDEVLSRLAQTRYHEKAARHTELDNFLAVSRINAHRVQPLDDESALLLAQSYSDFSGAYAYFTDLTALGASDYRQFFAEVGRLKTHSPVDANLQLGQFHSLIEWICLLRRRHVIGDGEAAKLFRVVCDRFASAEGAAAYTAASLASARAILGYCKPAEKIDTADEKIRACLLGSSAQATNRRSIEYRRVLDLQKVPSLDAMFSIYEGAAKLSTKGGGELTAIEKSAASLPVVELPMGTKVAGKEKESIVRYELAPIQKTLGQLAQKTGKSKPNSKEVEKLAQELLAELNAQVTLVLAGPVYAYFLRPTDLVVSEDPLLLRKHQYFTFASEGALRDVLPVSEFKPQSEGAGSYFIGGFAQFGLASGVAAGTGWKTGGPAGTEAIAAQIAAIRGTIWDRLEESDQRLVSLRTTAAREWIFESARRPEEFRALGEETMGLLSLARRADLLNGIESRNWRKVWDSVTLPDLFALGGKYLDRFKTDPWPSPATAALRSIAASNDGSRLNALGAITYHAFGCSHPHLMTDAPYEEYERHMFPAEIAERAAEFKLFLAFQADSLGVEPPALADVAESLAAKAFRASKMTDYRDWRSLLAAYASISPNDLKKALEQ